MQGSKSLLFATAIFSSGAIAGRATAQDYEGPRSLGLAQSLRALGNSNDAIYLNPAGIALSNMYSVELGYVDDARGSDRRFNGSIVDSQAGSLAAGVAYTYLKRRPDDLAESDERLQGHRFDLSLATRFIDTAALGVTARYLTLDRKNGETDIESGKVRSFTLDAGVQWRITTGLALGFAGYNLTNSSRPELPIGWGAGLGYALDALTLEGDVRYNAQRGEPTFSGGIGYVLSSVVPLRAGFQYERATKTLSLSVGLGIVLDRFSIDLGYRQKVNGEDVAPDADARVIGAAIRASVF